VSAYDNDPRVTKVAEDRYDLPGPEGWRVVHVPEIRRWYGVTEVDSFDQPLVGDTADETIALIIGAPR
jgi:hypothetical protein